MRMESGARRQALPGQSILVAEDEPLIALEIVDILEGAGAAVFTAKTVEHASEFTDLPELTAAVLDVRLQGKFVEPICMKMRKRGIPFIFHTGFSQGDVSRWNTPVVVKPASGTVLLGALKFALLEENDPDTDSGQIVAGEKRIERVRRIIERLSRRGFDTSAAEQLLQHMRESVRIA